MLLYSLLLTSVTSSWYVKDKDTYHAFFLEYPLYAPWESRWNEQSCGHMTSCDLIHWNYHGIVLAPNPGSWDDAGIGPGSIVRYNDKWYLLYTGKSHTPCQHGIGLAVSEDLMSWKRVGDHPVIPTVDYDLTCEDGTRIKPLADPFVYPEAVNGEYYLFLNCQTVGAELNHRGSIAVFRTRDFETFTPSHIAITDSSDRIANVCVWRHGNRWYMLGSAAISRYDQKGNVIDAYHQNRYYVAGKPDGVYRPCGALHFPEEPQFPNLHQHTSKVLPAPNGSDVILSNMADGVVGPYRIHYARNGAITVGAYGGEEGSPQVGTNKPCPR